MTPPYCLIVITILLFQRQWEVLGASFDPLLLDDISFVWKTSGLGEEYSLLYKENNTLVRQIINPTSVSMYCWVPHEVHDKSEIDAIPLIQGEPITLGCASAYDDNNIH